MKKLQWIKTKVGIFDDPKVRYMLHQPNGDSYVMVWFMLKDLAATINDHGLIYLSKKKAFDVGTLAYQLGRRRKFMEKALSIYEELELISRDEEGFITITTWADDQSGDRLDKIREQTRSRVAAYRQRQKDAPEAAVDASAQSEEPTQPAEPLPLDTPSKKHYEQAFGMVSPYIAKNLAEFERDWGEEAVCNAIDIAQDKGINNIKYIQGILRRGGGTETGRKNNGRCEDSRIDFDELFRKAAECDPFFRKGFPHEGNAAGNDD